MQFVEIENGRIRTQFGVWALCRALGVLGNRDTYFERHLVTGFSNNLIRFRVTHDENHEYNFYIFTILNGLGLELGQGRGPKHILGV